MKKLALTSAILLAVAGSAVAATQATQTSSQGGFNDGIGTNIAQNNIRKSDMRYSKRLDDRRDYCRYYDDYPGSGGFVDNNQTVTKATDVSKLKDNDRLVLEGMIEKQVGKRDFVFKDDSGSIEVEITLRAWAGQEITPNDKVRLFGEVDKSLSKTEVEIYRVLKVQ